MVGGRHRCVAKALPTRALRVCGAEIATGRGKAHISVEHNYIS